ncbi:MAG TPA: dipeptidase [Vicinamibacterales bacterium]|jgi:membrane dipeptidase|nr:dipeptidase [Vicinamibacterales bacterium]
MRTLLAGLIAAAAAAPPPTPSDDVLHKRAIVIDTHADTTQFITYRGIDIAKPQPEAQLDLPKAAAGGLDAQFFSIFVLPMRFKPDQFYGEALRQLDAIDKLAKDNPTRLRVARTAGDVRANAAAGVLSALYGLEGAHALLPGDHGAQLEHLRALAARGVRYMTLTWINSNDLGGSSGDAGDVRGLTPFGAEVIKEMNRLGVVVDVSHVSDPMFWDAVRASAKPVLATHSSARELTNIPRNMTDAMLKAVAANGGAVCVNFGSAFLDDRFHVAESAVWAKKRPGPPWEQWRQIRADARAIRPAVQLGRLLDHLQHVAKVAGVDHTCLGSDFDGVPATPTGMEDVSRLPAITAGLRARGLSPADVEKILGGNVLRVLEANEASAPATAKP